MTAFLKILFGAAFAAYIAFITWGSLSLPQKHWVFDKLGVEFDRTIPATRAHPEEDDLLSSINQDISPPTSNRPLGIPQSIQRNFEQHTTPSLCLKTPTRSINTVDKTSIYRWTDENGQVHFSDNKPNKQVSREVTEQYAHDKQYFRMNLSSPERGLPTLLGEQLQRDVNAIYSYLSDRMEADHLRQVDLNLKVFNTANGFEQYRQIHAPSLRSIAGFYTSLNNEAVVMQQHTDPQTRAVARHEATHVINAGLFGRSPIWFNEGIAGYFEQYDYANLKSGATHASQYHLSYLASEFKKNQLPSLRDYLQLSESEWRANDQRTMYAMAWSIIYLLQSHHEGEQFTRRLFSHMAENPCVTLDPIPFWREHYPGGLTKFNQRWQEMLLRAF
ncbi:DUF4124 domain-containing protein [Alkalimarinus alittae]|uniref:DUF4124 domain-containing protein n=1 Tax=Alkalimarinus alittae TaxID=2961619 RepID=A0ABY6N3C7_9ALTE|nr:DUF4124 domain-containing protein [Alkalimarinus alittae]UZE96502.1 DUF4124 domain-containing protein [Alkalimarinus alittae]